VPLHPAIHVVSAATAAVPPQDVGCGALGQRHNTQVSQPERITNFESLPKQETPAPTKAHCWSSMLFFRPGNSVNLLNQLECTKILPEIQILCRFFFFFYWLV
jgi:hypothetical protein